jgi:GNAT superfamily N-acetyltransferase
VTSTPPPGTPAAGPGRVRLATAADTDELVRLRRLMFDAMGVDTRNDRWEGAVAELIPHELAEDRLVAAVVDAPDGAATPAGSARLAASGIVQFERRMPGPDHPGTTRAYLSSMSTDPRWRQCGYGTSILARLMECCRDRGVGVVELHATDVGRRLYERVGFVLRPGAPEMRWSDRG